MYYKTYTYPIFYIESRPILITFTAGSKCLLLNKNVFYQSIVDTTLFRFLNKIFDPKTNIYNPIHKLETFILNSNVPGMANPYHQLNVSH